MRATTWFKIVYFQQVLVDQAWMGMMLKAMMAAVAAGAGLAAFTVAAQAFDHGCGDRAVECYEKVRRPDVYAIAERSVVIAPGRREVVHVPAVIQPRPYRVEVAPQRVHVERVPAVYSTLVRRQLVEPARVAYVHQPAIVQRVHERVVTHPGVVRWERSIGRHGEERLCKVHVPPVTATVARDVVVAPARRLAVSTPAVYRDVAVPVQVSPARTRHVVEPAVYAVAHRPVVLKPASTVIVEHPPVIGVERHRVLVKAGGSAWQRAGDHHW